METTKDFDDWRYWDRLDKNAMHPAEKPTIHEVVDYIRKLQSEKLQLGKAVAEANAEAKCAHQQFKVFADEIAVEVSKLATKRQSFGKNA